MGCGQSSARNPAPNTKQASAPPTNDNDGQQAATAPAAPVKACLLIIDMQNDFVSGSLKVGVDAETLVEPINRLHATIPFHVVAHTQDSHPPDHCSFNDNHGMEPFTKKMIPHPLGDGEIEQVCVWLSVCGFMCVCVCVCGCGCGCGCECPCVCVCECVYVYACVGACGCVRVGLCVRYARACVRVRVRACVHGERMYVRARVYVRVCVHVRACVRAPRLLVAAARNQARIRVHMLCTRTHMCQGSL